ncbi:hypothetical protein ABL78_1013 [Leptomonas seymouri]|uniref:Uncharacterized protein n=1 Tax=Leptomonas seymouri TaxID=5684 RepID=A0A0N1I9F7_LEPSE|nr:hypothetical protein ABL78_1013 [Leptomonas seymouri]|eukprot:KPI89844.1 hypothetical protein ABL78_1013 [Leptomonas seymouri]
MALVPLTQELQQTVEKVQQLRRTLHDAYIVEAASGRRSLKRGNKPPPAMVVHRTVDAPTLNILKSPNYPFTLCEEAPPSYVPPPVPYDVEGEIDSLKQRVLQVQEEFQNYQRKHSSGKSPLSRRQTLDFFGHCSTYAEMAWEVSSLQWFYRWVLSHSISHLWNCKEQLEYALTENGQSLPQSGEEMDACLRELPFSAAVSVLDMDRQSVVALERHRLHSVCRTFRDHLPVEAATMATSSYLTPEEKFMYQEFFNQSEHMLLLLNHTLMLNKANSKIIDGGRHNTQNGTTGQLPNSQDSVRGGSIGSGAVVTKDSMIGEMDTAGLTEETMNAVAAEEEVITTLMKTIHERQQRDEWFDVSDEVYEHSRKAQIAVYGCVLSDISLMGEQMSLVSEFVVHYENWLKLRGFQTHEELMSELSRIGGGTTWPTLSVYGDYHTGEFHEHFVPPTEAMLAHRPRQANKKNSDDVHEVAYTQAAPAMGPRAAPTGQKSLAETSSREKQMTEAQATTAPTKYTPANAAARRVSRGGDVAHAFYSILEHTAGGYPQGDGAVARAWLIAAVRFTVVKILQREWDVANTAKSIAQAEEELLGLLRRSGAYSHLTATAAALCVVAQEVARLCAARCEMRSLTVEVPVAVRVPVDADDYAQAVTDVANPVEQARWGCVVDALWFQADPSAQSSGGLLLQQTVATNGAAPFPTRRNKNSVLHFLYIESVDVPPISQKQCVTSINLRYRLPRMSPDTTSNRRVAPSLAAITKSQPSSNNGISRYLLARRVLAALSEIEVNGLLPCFACRVSEAAKVPLSQAMFIVFDDDNTSVVVDKSHAPLLCALPPAAIELKRLSADIDATPVSEASNDQCNKAYAEPANFSTIGLMVSAVLEELAVCVPTLSDLYMTASTVREQALWEIQSRVSSKCFTNATTHPIPVSCAPAKTRAISIQRESIANRNSTALRRFISPLLRNVDDQIASLGLDESSGRTRRLSNASAGPEGSVTTPRATPLQPVAGRQTQMVGRNGTTSPSPSAIQPNRR